LYLGIDTHALSVPACASALEVLAGNGVAVMFAEGDEYTPTPVIGASVYERIDSPATPEQEKQLATLSPEQVEQTELAGEKIGGMLTPAPGNEAPIRGLKVIAKSGWFAARPSGTENIYKIYTESFQGTDHLRRIPEEAQTIVSKAIAAAPNPKKDSRGK
jgi:phosphoglucomutase